MNKSPLAKPNQTITRLLIANRGEIALRIMRSAQKMGIHCIALFSDADENALHVKHADEAWHIGPSPAKDSYLDIAKVLAVAKQAQADAIHPGYGFLSENAGFAQAVKDADMIWVGPPVSAIKAMGSKSESKALMEQAHVPLVPGYHGDNQDDAFLAQQIKRIGFPVLIKASAGGGGKGMRVVEREADIASAIIGAKREGLNSFGDDKLLAEKYITRARHVEIQIFMDQHGNGVYLFERDCSIQRRHQKVLEEAPAPQFSVQERKAMGEAALQAARAINYEGAGTVEFLYDNGTFYFMEMNTRLQVEHPVTEMITGQDLVSWQIKVAQGDKLPLTQDELRIHGHAMEVRIYAEDPDNEFLPTTGTLEHVQLPTLIEGVVRLDTGVQQGDAVSPYYDPMISKLIVWGNNRDECLSNLKQALQQYQIAGITTNLPFLRRVIHVPAFQQGDVSTQFIEEFQDQLVNRHDIKPQHIIAAVCQHILQRTSLGKGRTASNDHTNPWHSLSALRINQATKETFTFKNTQGEPFTIEVVTLNDTQNSPHWQITINSINGINNDIHDVRARLQDDTVQYQLNGKWHKARVMIHQANIRVYDNESESQMSYAQTDFNQQTTQAGSLSAPMNGTIIQIDAQTGQTVKAGDVLMIMEAMKMEHAIKAPSHGTIKHICFNVGELVSEGATLIEMEEA